MREPWPADRDKALEQRRREIVEGALADEELMRQVRGSMADPAPPVSFRQVREELAARSAERDV